LIESATQCGSWSARNNHQSKQQQTEDGGGGIVSQDVNVVALVKGDERYLFLFNDEQKGETLRTLGKYASNPELSFSWCSQKGQKISEH